MVAAVESRGLEGGIDDRAPPQRLLWRTAMSCNVPEADVIIASGERKSGNTELCFYPVEGGEGAALLASYFPPSRVLRNRFPSPQAGWGDVVPLWGNNAVHCSVYDLDCFESVPGWP
jgi:hypothetical protein